MERRDFLKTAASTGVAATLPQVGFGQSVPKHAPVSRPQSPDMIYRDLGTTGEKVSAIGLGGAHLGNSDDAESMVRLVRSAIDRGVTFMDNCWDYSDGICEVRMGRALRDGYRDKVFLMTKMDGRTKESYTRQLEQSLGRLGTDTIDLVQFHECIRLDDPDRIFAEGGALEGAIAAREAGKIRYIGFTGHKDPVVHLRMFEMAQKHGFHFDTVQMPVNVMDASFRSFTKQVIPVAKQQGTGVLAMKTFGDPYIAEYLLKTKVMTPIDALHYGLSQQVSVVITGLDKPEILDQAITAAKTFKPMSEAQMASLTDSVRDAALTGVYEKFKTSPHYDGTIKNPQYLG